MPGADIFYSYFFRCSADGHVSLFYVSFYVIPNFLVVLISLSFSPLFAATLFRSSFASQLAQNPNNPNPKSNPNPNPNKTASRTACECLGSFITPGERSWRWRPCRGRSPTAPRPPTPRRIRRRSASPSSALPRSRIPNIPNSKIRERQNPRIGSPPRPPRAEGGPPCTRRPPRATRTRSRPPPGAAAANRHCLHRRKSSQTARSSSGASSRDSSDQLLSGVTRCDHLLPGATICHAICCVLAATCYSGFASSVIAQRTTWTYSSSRRRSPSIPNSPLLGPPSPNPKSFKKNIFSPAII